MIRSSILFSCTDILGRFVPGMSSARKSDRKRMLKKGGEQNEMEYEN
jgi:hypothetical protein